MCSREQFHFQHFGSCALKVHNCKQRVPDSWCHDGDNTDWKLSPAARVVVGWRISEYELVDGNEASHVNKPVVPFLPRDALVHSAVLRLHVVRLSVCLSVTLMDQEHIGWKCWKLIARSIRPTPSLFVAQRPST